MPEKTLPLKLAGDEIRIALMDKVEQALKQHCFLNPNTSYDFFSGSIVINLQLSDAGVDFPVVVSPVLSQGESATGEIEETKVEIDIPALPPNQVRIETGQGVPAETTDKATGKPVVKKITYARGGKAATR